MPLAPHPPGTHASLRERLAEEIAALQAFIAALNDEQAALRAADAEALPARTDHKQRCMHELNAMTAARNAALAALGFPADRDGLARAGAADAPVGGEIDRLVRLAAEAAEINRVNGRLIATQLQSTQDALRALGLGRGDAAGRLYAADASAQETAPLTGVRIIDSA